MTDSSDPTRPAAVPHRTWIDLCLLAEVPERDGLYVALDGRPLAVFRSSDAQTVHVMDDACPHAGGSLASGHIAHGCVVCPWHAWMFNLESGRCPDNPAIKTRTYPVRVVDGQVQILLVD